MVYVGLPDSHISPDLLSKTSCLFASALVTLKIVGDGPLKMSVRTGLVSIPSHRHPPFTEQTSEPDQPRSYRTFIALLGLTPPHQQDTVNLWETSAGLQKPSKKILSLRV